MSDFNNIVLTGRLVKDVESRQAGEHTVYTFTIAESHKKDKTNFIECESWNKQGEVIQKYFSKGSRIGITGKLEQDKWTVDGKNYSKLKIVVDSFIFLDKKEGGVQQAFSGEASREPNPFNDNDIPF